MSFTLAKQFSFGLLRPSARKPSDRLRTLMWYTSRSWQTDRLQTLSGFELGRMTNSPSGRSRKMPSASLRLTFSNHGTSENATIRLFFFNDTQFRMYYRGRFRFRPAARPSSRGAVCTSGRIRPRRVL